MRFSLLSILVMAVGLPICVGLVVAIDQLAYLAAFVYLGFPLSWDLLSTGLCDGVPEFLYARLLMAELRLPGWLVLCFLAFTLGMLRSRTSHVLMWFLPISIFAIPLIEELLGAEVSFVALYNPWRDVAACGAVLVAGCGAIGYWVRGRTPARSNGPPKSVRVGLLAFASATTLLLASFGWAFLHDPDLVPGMRWLRVATILFVVVVPATPVTLFVQDMLASRRVNAIGQSGRKPARELD